MDLHVALRDDTLVEASLEGILDSLLENRIVVQLVVQKLDVLLMQGDEVGHVALEVDVLLVGGGVLLGDVGGLR